MMKPPPRQGKLKEIFWRKTLARFGVSGLTQTEFCKRENLNPANLSWWKGEIARRDFEADGADGAESQDADEREIYWRKTIGKFNAGGLSKDDFCAREGIKPAVFSWWRAELLRRDSRSAASPQMDMFVPVAVTPKHKSRAMPTEPQAIAEIDVVAGTVRVFENASTDALIALLRAIKELAT